jgi:hypothetical protein
LAHSGASGHASEPPLARTVGRSVMIRALPRRGSPASEECRWPDRLGDTGRVRHLDPGHADRRWVSPRRVCRVLLCARHLLPAGMLGAEEDANVEQMLVAVSEKDELRHVWGRLSLPASVVAELRQLIRLLPSRRHHWRGAVVALREPP